MIKGNKSLDEICVNVNITKFQILKFIKMLDIPFIHK